MVDPFGEGGGFVDAIEVVTRGLHQQEVTVRHAAQALLCDLGDLGGEGL